MQATYAKLRDWLLVKSGELEEWIRSDVLPLDERFEEAFSHRSKPASILDQEDVATSMEEAESYHKPFCATRFLILRRAAGETTRFPLMEYTEEVCILMKSISVRSVNLFIKGSNPCPCAGRTSASLLLSTIRSHWISAGPNGGRRGGLGASTDPARRIHLTVASSIRSAGST